MRIERTVFDWHFCPHARKTEIQQQQQKVATHPDCLGGRSQCQAPLLRVSEWELATTMRHTVCTVHTHARRVLSVAHSYMPTRLHSHTTKKLTQNSRTNKRNEFAATTTTTKRRRRDESSPWLSCVQSMRTSQSGRNSRTRLAVHFREKLRVCASYTCIPQMYLWVCVCVQMTNAFDFKTDS